LPDNPQIQQELATALLTAAGGSRRRDAALPDLLATLVNALPFYGDPAFIAAHRGSIVNLLVTSIRSAPIASQPREEGKTTSTVYRYNGPYSDYGAAFFPGVSRSAAASAIASEAAALGLPEEYWGTYGLSALTDAVRQATSYPVNSELLTTFLGLAIMRFVPVISPSAYAVYGYGYEPTATALAAIRNAGESAASYAAVREALLDEGFRAECNYLLGNASESGAATWFLYQVWLTLKALGSPDVDADIAAAKTAGLQVPVQLDPVVWWNGSYRSWYADVSGSDVASLAGASLTASMPQWATMVFVPPPFRDPMEWQASTANGYAQSLLYWGELSLFKPVDTSCLGGASRVRMADGAFRAIETLRVGDEVSTTLGPRKIALIEHPLRLGRTLHRIDDLEVTLTAGHPVRLADTAGPRHAAVDPWIAMDTVPSMTAEGISRLRPGVRLESGGEPVTVTKITEEAAGDESERVYDLLLENWERDHPAVLVGDPENFFAVDPEAADPTYDLPAALGIVAAVEAAVGASRENVPDPQRQLRGRMAPLSLGLSPVSHAVPTPSIPGPELYTVDGEWDPHASTLETELTRRFGRNLRRLASTGWRPLQAGVDAGLRLVVFDVELVGDVTLDGELSLGFVLDEPPRHRFELTAPATSWHLRIDRSIELGSGAFSGCDGFVAMAGRPLARFRIGSATPMWKEPTEIFLFAPDATAIGRIAVAFASDVPTSRTRRAAIETAVSLGDSIGRQLRDSILPPDNGSGTIGPEA
jgi:hypothetical protein